MASTINKNQPMREAEIDIADFINDELLNYIGENISEAIPNDSISFKQLDPEVKLLQTKVESRLATVVIPAGTRIMCDKITVQTDITAQGDYHYHLAGAFANMRMEFTDKFQRSPFFMTATIDSVSGNTTNVGILVIALSELAEETTIPVDLTLIWQCEQVIPK